MCFSCHNAEPAGSAHSGPQTIWRHARSVELTVEEPRAGGRKAWTIVQFCDKNGHLLRRKDAVAARGTLVRGAGGSRVRFTTGFGISLTISFGFR
jgi:hypothetical protein